MHSVAVLAWNTALMHHLEIVAEDKYFFSNMLIMYAINYSVFLITKSVIKRCLDIQVFIFIH